MDNINVIFTRTECAMLRKAINVQRDKCFDRMNAMSNERIRLMKNGEWTDEMVAEFDRWYGTEQRELDKWNYLLTHMSFANMTGTNPFINTDEE